ncbi:uncharacterized protein LOC129583843 isoform X2 [Paramacrobiotus metropolitanus]|uniref:uncharacterized protein LOC129583843 isoform X2 n=1 Tax=Paramacrobiotus metropolitanus TaxID=2943436 RepID=UPI002446026E|nr:uncharacterized protein LOC129583843 isoform X2 [Paramacrobiotus metropolitanus]
MAPAISDPASGEKERYRKKVYNALVCGVLLHNSFTTLEAEQQFFNDHDPLMLDEALEKAGFRNLMEFVDAHPSDIVCRNTQVGVMLYPGPSPPELIASNMRLIRTTQKHRKPDPFNLEKGILSRFVHARLRRDGHKISAGVVGKKCESHGRGSATTSHPTSSYDRLISAPTLGRSASTYRSSQPSYRPKPFVRPYVPRVQTNYYPPPVRAYPTRNPYPKYEKRITVPTSTGYSCTIPDRPLRYIFVPCYRPLLFPVLYPPPLRLPFPAEPPPPIYDRDAVQPTYQREPSRDTGADPSCPWDMPSRPRSASANPEQREFEKRSGMSNEQFLLANVQRRPSARKSRAGNTRRVGLSSDVVQDDLDENGDYLDEFHNNSSGSEDGYAIPVSKVFPRESSSTDSGVRDINTGSTAKLPQSPEIPPAQTSVVNGEKTTAPPVRPASTVPPCTTSEQLDEETVAPPVCMGGIKLRRRTLFGSSASNSCMSLASCNMNLLSRIGFAEELNAVGSPSDDRSESTLQNEDYTVVEPTAKEVISVPEADLLDLTASPPAKNTIPTVIDHQFSVSILNGSGDATDSDQTSQRGSIWRDRLVTYYKHPIRATH